ELLVSTQPHTDSAVEMVGNTGVAVAVIALCLLVTRVPVPRVLLTPVSASGAMSLTVYSLHIVYIRFLGDDAVWYPTSNWPLIALVLATLVLATAWQLLCGQGPFERALHALIRSEPATAQPTWASPAGPAPSAPGHVPTAQPTWASPAPPGAVVPSPGAPAAPPPGAPLPPGPAGPTGPAGRWPDPHAPGRR